jgi:hypothetical protein
MTNIPPAPPIGPLGPGAQGDPALQRPRVSALSVGFAVAGIALGVGCWALWHFLVAGAGNQASAMLTIWALILTGPFILLAGVVCSILAFIPRGRVWLLATVGLLANLSLPMYVFAREAASPEAGLWYLGWVILQLAALALGVWWLGVIARRRRWPGALAKTALGLLIAFTALLAAGGFLYLCL